MGIMPTIWFMFVVENFILSAIHVRSTEIVYLKLDFDAFRLFYSLQPSFPQETINQVTSNICWAQSNQG